jgi:hypothetical protein
MGKTKKKRMNKKNKTRQAGVIAPFLNEHKEIKINYTDGTDCLAQCFYALRYTNLANSLLLRKIGAENWGVSRHNAKLLLDAAYGVNHQWINCDFRYATNNGTVRFTKANTPVMSRKAHQLRVVEMVKRHLKPNEGVLGFLSKFPKMYPIRKQPYYWSNHFMVIFLDNKGEVMIRDPQINEILPLKKYLNKWKRTHDGISILIEDEPTEHTEYAVTQEVIASIFGDEYNLNMSGYDEFNGYDKDYYKNYDASNYDFTKNEY